MSEGSLQKYFKDQCKAKGVFWRKIKFEGQRGCPDVMIAYAGKIVLVELKTNTGRGILSPLQERQIEKLTAAGVAVRVINSKEGLDAIIRDITTP